MSGFFLSLLLRLAVDSFDHPVSLVLNSVHELSPVRHLVPREVFVFLRSKIVKAIKLLVEGIRITTFDRHSMECSLEIFLRMNGEIESSSIRFDFSDSITGHPLGVLFHPEAIHHLCVRSNESIIYCVSSSEIAGDQQGRGNGELGQADACTSDRTTSCSFKLAHHHLIGGSGKLVDLHLGDAHISGRHTRLYFVKHRLSVIRTHLSTHIILEDVCGLVGGRSVFFSLRDRPSVTDVGLMLLDAGCITFVGGHSAEPTRRGGLNKRGTISEEMCRRFNHTSEIKHQVLGCELHGLFFALLRCEFIPPLHSVITKVIKSTIDFIRVASVDVEDVISCITL